MGYMYCSINKCRSMAHGAHDARGQNLCKKCYVAYMIGVSQYKQFIEGEKFPYKFGGETWEKD